MKTQEAVGSPFFPAPGTGLQPPVGAGEPGSPPQLPPKCVLALGPEEVNVRFELQLEDMLLVDAISLPGDAHTVAQQGEAGQGVVILEGSMVPWAFPSLLSFPPSSPPVAVGSHRATGRGPGEGKEILK